MLVVFICGFGIPAMGEQPTPEQIEKMKAAAPDQAAAKPAKPRRMLVFNLCKGFRHSSIECGAKALEIMGSKTGAYEAVASDDVAMFKPENLAKFDAICFNNTTGELFDDPALRKSLMDFVKSGKGIVGIHAATDCFYKWAEFGEMMGGYFHGHPWGANDTVTLKIEEPDHPLCAPFEDRNFVVTDEIYQFREPYSRERLRVLLSLDISKTNMKKKGIHRRDGDFAVSWVRAYGQGRVFYCSLGHREDIFWNPTVLQHYLAGIQYALGDLKADASPSTRATQSKETGWVSLFNGKDLSHWHGLIANPVERAKMTEAQVKIAWSKTNEREHWKVADGALVFDGSHGGSHLCTTRQYSDFELMLDWKIEPGGDSGIYLRGCPQVQIWDFTQHPEGSGGLYNNQKHPSKPLKCADKPIGEWNTFRIKMVGERVTVWLNDVLVVDNVVLENYWERDRAVYPKGEIELQSHGTPLHFKNIRIRQID
jgi:type 1 glutamine amidotransferase